MTTNVEENVFVNETICAICLEETSDTPQHCSHVFHTSCLEQWLISHGTCPVCRIQLKEEMNAETNPQSMHTATRIDAIFAVTSRRMRISYWIVYMVALSLFLNDTILYWDVLLIVFALLSIRVGGNLLPITLIFNVYCTFSCIHVLECAMFCTSKITRCISYLIMFFNLLHFQHFLWRAQLALVSGP